MEGIQLLLIPFVWILKVFYSIFNSYGIALILFALLVKVILFPFSIKGKRSMIQMNMLNGQSEKLRKMYGNNQEKYNTELQKLYEKENVNPMSGCLWSFLPILVIFPLYAIIRQPLTYMMDLRPDVIEQVAKVLDWSNVAVAKGWIPAAADFVNGGVNQLYLSSLITPDNLAAVQQAAGEGAFVLNFDFLGVDLALIPQLKFWVNGITWGAIGLFLLPVISAASGLIFSLVSMKTNAVNQQSAQAANNPTNKTMLLISPLMSLWIGFSMPAALSIYWIANSVFSMLQEVIAGKLLKKDYEKAAEEKARRELQDKEEEKRLKEEARIERARRLEEARQNKGKKKASAKKDEETAPSVNKDDSRVGLRAYARGRAYDPYRFSPDGPTPYRDAVVDDAAVEKALEERAEAEEKAREKAEFAEKYHLSEEDMKELEEELPEEGEESGSTGEPDRETPAGDVQDEPEL